jgi:hypothetical protein
MLWFLDIGRRSIPSGNKCRLKLFIFHESFSSYQISIIRRLSHICDRIERAVENRLILLSSRDWSKNLFVEWWATDGIQDHWINIASIPFIVLWLRCMLILKEIISSFINNLFWRNLSRNFQRPCGILSSPSKRIIIDAYSLQSVKFRSLYQRFSHFELIKSRIIVFL